MTTMNDLANFSIASEPFYRPSHNEIDLFEAAHAEHLPVMLKGPTGCGKTRFVEYMAWRLQRPLITVACHEDLTAADLVGRYLLDANGTQWHDGPLTHAVRSGAICYLDEIVEARQDCVVVIHPLTDSRRILPLERRNELLRAHPEFQLVISYNPGYQSAIKSLKESTKQRFTAIEFNWPEETIEAEIIAQESGITLATASILVQIAQHSRQLVGAELNEGISTRMLIHSARLHARGIDLSAACMAGLVYPLSDDADVRDTLANIVACCQ